MSPAPTSSGSQTLSRGIRLIEMLAEAPTPLSIDELAAQLDVHRSIAYRLLRTLEGHGLVVRDSVGRVSLGPRLAALASTVARDLQAAALPELTAAAAELGMTCFLAVADREECITLASVEPRHSVASVVQRPGARHPLTVGAPSKAILSLLPPEQWPAGTDARLHDEVAATRARGFATSHDEVIPTVKSVSVPLSLSAAHRPSAVAVVYAGDTDDTARIAERLQRAARAIGEALGMH